MNKITWFNKVECIEHGKTQVQFAEEIDTTKVYVNRVIKKQGGVVNKTFVQMMEELKDIVPLDKENPLDLVETIELVIRKQ